jgi:hypothetical protein
MALIYEAEIQIASNARVKSEGDCEETTLKGSQELV